MRQIDSVYQRWWDIWYSQKLSDYIPKRKEWTKNQGEIRKNDIVIFLKLDKDQTFGTTVWRVARATEIHVSKDGKDHSVTLEYKNPNESTFRKVKRSIRSVAVLCSEDEISLGEKMGLAHAEALPLSHLTWQSIK